MNENNIHGEERVVLNEEPISESEKTWGMIVHLSALIQFFFHFFGLIIGPLVIWLIKKEGMPFVDDQGREALNFNMSVTLYALIIGIITSLIPFSFHRFDFYHTIPIEINGLWIGMFSSVSMIFLVIILLALFFFWLINIIRGAVKANKGIRFRYPLTIHFLSNKKDRK